MKLSDCSMLVALNISQWTARKYDKKATKEIADKHGVYDLVGRYNKLLLPMEDTLKAVTNYAAGMRQKFYLNTLPYTYEGVRLLPSKGYFEFVNMMNSDIVIWRTMVDVFVDSYTQRVVNAEQLLGTLYNVEDYPPADKIKDRFQIGLIISPVPDAKGFYDVLSEDMAKAQAAEYIKSAESTAQKAMQDCWNRLYEAVQRINDKLSKDNLREDHVQGMLDFAEDTCAVLERLNIANDPNLEALRLEVLKSLVPYNAQLLSAHDGIKAKAKAESDAILRKMGGFMGVSNGNRR